MKKKEYISPSMYWVWIGMNKAVADMEVPAVAGSQTGGGYAGRTNVWGTEESSDENEVWGQSW